MARTGDKDGIRRLFDSIAHRYDLLNHLLSGGIDIYWRRRAIAHLADLHPQRILDVATGTADFAIAALRLSPENVVGVDIAEEMLKRGRMKLARRGINGIVSLERGEAEHLPFPDGAFDATIVAFGARNFEYLERGLAEMHRVLRPGGRIVVLEFSRPRAFPFKQIYLLYFRHLLPRIGRLISHHADAYTYLPDTVMQFPDGDDFAGILERIGFQQPRQERMSFGIATVYSADKPTVALHPSHTPHVPEVSNGS